MISAGTRQRLSALAVRYPVIFLLCLIGCVLQLVLSHDAWPQSWLAVSAATLAALSLQWAGEQRGTPLARIIVFQLFTCAFVAVLAFTGRLDPILLLPLLLLPFAVVSFEQDEMRSGQAAVLLFSSLLFSWMVVILIQITLVALLSLFQTFIPGFSALGTITTLLPGLTSVLFYGVLLECWSRRRAAAFVYPAECRILLLLFIPLLLISGLLLVINGSSLTPVSANISSFVLFGIWAVTGFLILWMAEPLLTTAAYHGRLRRLFGIEWIIAGAVFLAVAQYARDNDVDYTALIPICIVALWAIVAGISHAGFVHLSRSRLLVSLIVPLLLYALSPADWNALALQGDAERFIAHYRAARTQQDRELLRDELKSLTRRNGLVALQPLLPDKDLRALTQEHDYARQIELLRALQMEPRFATNAQRKAEFPDVLLFEPKNHSLLGSDNGALDVRGYDYAVHYDITKNRPATVRLPNGLDVIVDLSGEHIALSYANVHNVKLDVMPSVTFQKQGASPTQPLPGIMEFRFPTFNAFLTVESALAMRDAKDGPLRLTAAQGMLLLTQPSTEK